VGLVNAGVGRRGIGASVGVGPFRVGGGVGYGAMGGAVSAMITMMVFCLVIFAQVVFYVLRGLFRRAGGGWQGLLVAGGGGGAMYGVLALGSELDSALVAWVGVAVAWALSWGVAVLVGERRRAPGAPAPSRSGAGATRTSLPARICSACRSQVSAVADGLGRCGPCASVVPAGGGRISYRKA
jgi:hypothetical protein